MPLEVEGDHLDSVRQQFHAIFHVPSFGQTAAPAFTAWRAALLSTCTRLAHRIPPPSPGPRPSARLPRMSRCRPRFRHRSPTPRGRKCFALPCPETDCGHCWLRWVETRRAPSLDIPCCDSRFANDAYNYGQACALAIPCGSTYSSNGISAGTTWPSRTITAWAL